jgi:hypothetical protein
MNSLLGRIQAVLHITLQLDTMATIKITYEHNSLHIIFHVKP